MRKKISVNESGPCNKLQTHNFYVCGRVGAGWWYYFIISLLRSRG